MTPEMSQLARNCRKEVHALVSGVRPSLWLQSLQRAENSPRSSALAFLPHSTNKGIKGCTRVRE